MEAVDSGGGAVSREGLGEEAKEAAQLFQSQRYSECLVILQQLLLKKEDDPKVLHNIAIVKFYQDGCTEPQKLLDVLAKIKGKSEEMARAAEEQLEGIGISIVNNPSTSSTASSRSTAIAGGNGGQSAPVSPVHSGLGGETIAYLEDYDTSIPTLNTAVILYHLQQYAAALAVLEPLYNNIEPIDEMAALRVCLLMLDITLASGQPGKAASVLQTMEKAFGHFLYPAEGGGASVQSQSVVHTHLLNSVGVTTGSTDGSNIASGGPSSLINSPSGELGLTRTSSEEVLDEEALSIGLDIGGSEEVRSAASLPLSSTLIRAPLVEKNLPAFVADLKLMLHLYKVRLLLLTRNLKATKREVKSALNLSRDHLTALLLKAQLEYSRANYRKAIKLLTTCSNRADSGMCAMFLSNLGCIYHQLQKDQTAAVFFRKALQASTSIGMEMPLKVTTFSQDKSLAILYNAGLQQLICGNPIVAAACFQEAGSLYYNRPLLWLRLAECCILALEKGLLKPTVEYGSCKKDDLKVSVVGDGKWRRVVLPSGNLNPTIKNNPLGLAVNDEEEPSPDISESEDLFFVPGKPHTLSLAFASQCLRMALYLLNKKDAKAAEIEAAAAARAAEVQDSDETAISSTSQPHKNGTMVDKKGSSNGSSGAHGSQVSPNGGEGKEGKVFTGTSSTITAAVATFAEDRKREHNGIRQCAMANLAYVELCLQNPLRALKTAVLLLGQPELSRTSTFLGHMYAAESLCLLDRPREAADHLSACIVESASAEPSNSVAEDDSQKWRSGENSEASGDGEDSTSVNGFNLGATGALPDALSLSKLTGSRSRVSLYVNLAAVHVMQGDLLQAYQWATQAVTITPANPLAVLAVVYVELIRGHREEAIIMLKHCRHLCVVSPSALSS